MITTMLMMAATLSWVEPTTREDGTAMTTEEISHYVLYRNDVAELQIPAPATTADVTKNGHWYITAVDIDDQESAPSNVVHIKGKPSAPSNLQRVK